MTLNNYWRPLSLRSDIHLVNVSNYWLPIRIQILSLIGCIVNITCLPLPLQCLDSGCEARGDKSDCFHQGDEPIFCSALFCVGFLPGLFARLSHKRNPQDLGNVPFHSVPAHTGSWWLNLGIHFLFKWLCSSYWYLLDAIQYWRNIKPGQEEARFLTLCKKDCSLKKGKRAFWNLSSNFVSALPRLLWWHPTCLERANKCKDRKTH